MARSRAKRAVCGRCEVRGAPRRRVRRNRAGKVRDRVRVCEKRMAWWLLLDEAGGYGRGDVLSLFR
jgi:hypothetical protein